MVFALATTENVVRWYAFSPAEPSQAFEIIDHLDLARVPRMPKAEAVRWAKQFDLKTWRLVGFY